MTKYEYYKVKRDEELAAAAKAATAGDINLLRFHSSAAAGFTIKLENATVEELEQQA